MENGSCLGHADVALTNFFAVNAAFDSPLEDLHMSFVHRDQMMHVDRCRSPYCRFNPAQASGCGQRSPACLMQTQARLLQRCALKHVFQLVRLFDELLGEEKGRHIQHITKFPSTSILGLVVDDVLLAAAAAVKLES